MRPRRLHRFMLLAAATGALAVVLPAYGFDVLKRTDLATVDMRFDVRGERDAPDDLVFVKIDDETFSDLDTTFPFPRGLHAAVIDRLAEAGARVIAYDVQFTEPSDDARQDNRLIEAVRAAGNVVLPTTEVDERGRTRIFGGGEGLRYSRALAANALLPHDPGGVFRRMEFEVGGLETFPMVAAEAALGHDVERAGADSAYIDFPGPPGTIRSISFGRVHAGRFDEELVRDKVVVVGAASPSLQDLHRTSTTSDELMPGPEIQAAAIDTALLGLPLDEAPVWIDVLLIVVMGLAAPLLALRVPSLKAVALAVLMGAGLLVLAQLLFNGGTIVSVIYPLLAALLSVTAVVILHGITSAFERERARDAFARFVPEAVVGQVLDQADGMRLGGKRTESTLLFSDLRGFTSFSERREPHEVVTILNRYLSAMSDAILDHGGTLTSYMGDGIMAVFGAPIEQDDHADRALAASCEMLRRLAGFNAWMREEGLGDGFKMGIGLNTGPVLSGNVGSERRLEYTAIGDVTNTASRLEGLTKGTPHQLYLAESTRAALTESPAELEVVGDFEVRGREDRIRVWTLPSTCHQAGEGEANLYSPAAGAAPRGAGRDHGRAEEHAPCAERTEDIQ